MYYIYRITNKLNGKTYIGQHKYKDLSIDKYMGSGKYLWNAIHRYGIENFEKEILVSGITTKEEVDKLEREYIKIERSSNHSEYNISDGGTGGWNLSGENSPTYGRRCIHNLEGYEKFIPKDSPLPKDYFEGRSQKTLDKMSKALKGENNPLYGKSRSNEIKVKISESCKGKQVSEEHRKNISNSLKGRNLSDTHKNNLSKSAKLVNSGQSNPMYGKHHSEDTKRKISESHKFRIGKRYYNNGIECHMYEPGNEPEGYILGRL